ncbi:MAG: putative oxidoreductase [Vicingaceae bacterium]|jgi:putative oxidoreductase
MTVDPFLPLMLRVILGSLFFFQAYDKIVRIGLVENFQIYREACESKKVPLWFMKASVFLSSYIELIGGFLLIVGFFKSYTMLFLGIDLIMVSIGFGYLQGLWDMRHVFPRIVLLSLLYLIPDGQDIWSVDFLFSGFFPIG